MLEISGRISYREWKEKRKSEEKSEKEIKSMELDDWTYEN